MSKLDTAMDRFAQALDLLEGAMQNHKSRLQSSDGLERELAGLRADRARLAEELAAMRERADRLTDLNVRASNQLGGAIDELNRVLAAD